MIGRRTVVSSTFFFGDENDIRVSDDENDIRVSEIWESREKLDAFGDKLRPRMEEAGIRLSGEPEVFEAHIVETF